MSITPFLSGQAYQPEMVRAMSTAFDNACKSLKLVDRSGQQAELIARDIIELATSGEQDAERLCAIVLAIYKPPAE